MLSPLIGLGLGFCIMATIFWLCRKSTPVRVDTLFRRLQLLSAALFSLGHGANDAQKTMGIIASALFAGGYISTFEIPLWVELAANTAIAAGTLSGGWRIIHTMGSKITRLQPVGGFAAETAGAFSLFTATALGVPVSTTHTITGAIVGVGATRRLSAVRWGVAGQIVWAWVLTIPAAAAIAAATYYLLVAGGFTRLHPALRRAATRRTGRRRPGRFAALTLPPCSSARCLTIARPSPVPPGRPRDLSTR